MEITATEVRACESVKNKELMAPYNKLTSALLSPVVVVAKMLALGSQRQ